MRIPKLEKYSLYSVLFYDHSVGHDHEMIIQSVGFFVKATKKSLIFSHWIVKEDDEKTVDENLEYCSIIKSAIIEIKKIKNPGKLQ